MKHILYFLYRIRVYLFPHKGNFGKLGACAHRQKFPKKTMLVRITHHNGKKETAVWDHRKAPFLIEHKPVFTKKGSYRKKQGLKPCSVNEIVSWVELPMRKR